MKSIVMSACLLLSGFAGLCQEDGNYTITINGKKTDIDLGKEYSFTSGKGEEIKYSIVQKDILNYKDETLAFKYFADHSVAKTEVGEGIVQIALITANGSGFIIQKYSTLNPESLVDLMLQEITKESLNYGYTKKDDSYKRKLASGQTITGKSRVLNYQDDEQNYTVACYGNKDSGVLVMTMINKENVEKDQKILDLFLQSLKLNDVK